jgi:ATP-dependent helicase HrpB
MPSPPELPIDRILPELLAALERSPAAVLRAPTGSGKTTRVPPALLDAAWRGQRRILMLEPRRLAARAAAGFMAQAMGERVGETVGYRTRLDRRISRSTRIEVVTEGILTRIIQSDPELADYAAVVFDEFHERSLAADLGLALVRESQQALREDLRVVVMSATIETDRVSELLAHCPVIEAEGRSHPVEVRYRPPLRRRRREAHTAAVVVEAVETEAGSALVFLPGMREIRAVAARLEGRLPPDVVVYPLHGQLERSAQDAAIRAARDGERKVVLSSAVAESSLTIEGIRVVVDAGWQRRARFDPGSGMTRLVTERVSKASAEQRRGRAGRIEPGVCYRLWSESEHARLKPQAAPEILTADLAPLVLELAQWGVCDPSELTWLDPPPAAPWQQAVELLQSLDAVDAEARITAHGRSMLALGLHPRLANMVLLGRRVNRARMAAELAALLSERDVGRFDSADVRLRLELLRERPRGGVLARIRKTADKLSTNQPGNLSTEAAGALLASAWPERIGRRRPGQRGRFRLSNGRGAFLEASDPLAGSEFIVACDLDGQAREARIHLGAALDRADLETLLGEHIEEQTFADWDDARGRVVARHRRCLGALVLDESELDKPGREVLESGLLEAVKRKGVASLPFDEASRQLQARVELLRGLWPDDWPDLSDAALQGELERWLRPWLAGLETWRAVQALDMAAILESRLGHERLKRLGQLAPRYLQLPNGRRARIEYRGDGAPSVSVRLQAMLGCRETPTIAMGRIPVAIHLLSPADRPLAITADLASFWTNAYPEVRKDMRGRYPKHRWPADPLQG